MAAKNWFSLKICHSKSVYHRIWAWFEFSGCGGEGLFSIIAMSYAQKKNKLYIFKYLEECKKSW